MKKLLSVSLILIISYNSFTQQNGGKKSLFSNSPNKVECNSTLLADLFLKTTNAAITINFSTDFSFSGTITSNVVKYENLQTIIIKSSVDPNLIFSISKRKEKDNSIVYVGRMISFQSTDMYEIKVENGKYFLQKNLLEKIISTCS